MTDLEFSGTLESIETKSSANGDYRVFTISGQKYGVWEPTLGKDLKLNENVEGTFTQKGKYKNLATIKKSEKQPETKQVEIKQFTGFTRAELKGIMWDTLIEVNDMYEKLPLNESFKANLDWTKIALSLYIAKTKANK